MNLTGVILGNEVLYNQAAIYDCLRRERVGDVFRVIWCVVQQKPYKALWFCCTPGSSCLNDKQPEQSLLIVNQGVGRVIIPNDEWIRLHKMARQK